MIEGTISRDFFSGDFVIKAPSGVRDVPQEQFGAMTYEGSAISTPGAWLGALTILIAGLLAMFGPSRGSGHLWRLRSNRGKIGHETLPPSKRES